MTTANQQLPLVYLARHGETAWTITGQHTGLTDLPLTDRGERNARQLGQRLQELAFARVLTSPLRRAAQTCDLAGFGAVANVDHDLVEWNYGDYEGKTPAEIGQQRPGWDLLKELRREGTTILLTTHNMAEADELCDRVAIIDHGRILVCDAPARLKHNAGMQTEIHLDLPEAPQDLLVALRALPGIDSAVSDPHGIRLLASGRDGVLQRVVEVAHGHALQNISVREPTLESVFIELTGRPLRD